MQWWVAGLLWLASANAYAEPSVGVKPSLIGLVVLGLGLAVAVAAHRWLPMEKGPLRMGAALGCGFLFVVVGFMVLPLMMILITGRTM